jgi:cation:H+ antiporter
LNDASPALLVPLFVLSLAVTLGAARQFARRLDRHATALGMPEALVGVLTALAADSPEISSALVALVKGAHAASVGVIVGSNAFNLAAMIGASALLAGSVRLPREALFLEGAVGVLVLLVGAAVLLDVVPPIGAALVVTALLVPYVLLLILGPRIIARLPLSTRVTGRLGRALSEHGRPDRNRLAQEPPAWHQTMLFAWDVALILLGSIGMVQAALALGDRWHLRGAVIGVVVLAPLTSLPNAITAIRLGLADRGSALVSETFNSNTINLVAGVIAPALFAAMPGLSLGARLGLLWLGAMTVTSFVFLAWTGGLRRGGAAVLVFLYLGFVAIQFVSL